MESLIAFMVTFSAAVPVFIVAAVILAALRRRMSRLRREDIAPGEKRLRAFIGAAASLATATILPPSLYLVARGNEAAEVTVIVSSVFIIPLSYFVIAALVSSALAILSTLGKGRGEGETNGRS